MNKKFLSFILTIVLIVSGLAPVFGAEETGSAAQAYNIAPNMEFTGTPVSISLVAAVKRITTEGPGFESAVLRKETLEAQALSQEDLWSSWVRVSRAMSGVPNMQLDPTKSLDAKIIKITRPYLITQAALQFQIDINMMGYETTQAYYRVIQAEEGLKIAKDNLQNTKNILANTNKKFELGVVSKMDVLTAESAVQDAEVKVSSADVTLKSLKMSFNQKMNFSLMQDVRLTDTLTKTTVGSIYLKGCIESALKNRNELNQLQFALNKANLELSDKNMVSRYSGEYLTALLEVKQAEKNLKDTKQLIEMDIRSRYLTIQNIQAEIASLEKTVSNAKEGYRLSDLSFNAGMNTLVDVQEAQLASFNAQLGLSNKILEYNLAISDLSIVIGLGKPSAGQ
jgi:hypothetical protein